MDLLQFKQKYVEDATSLLNNLDNDLIVFEKNPTDRECIEQIFRVMHTLKGTSGMYGFNFISDLTHDLESVFGQVRDGALSVTTELINITLASVDHIRNLLADEYLSDPQNASLHAQIKQQLNDIHQTVGNVKIPSVQVKKDFSDSITRTWQILFTPTDQIFKRAINILFTFSDLLNLGYYRIQEPNFNEKITFWTIFLVTDKSLNEIEDALVFVMDYCKIQLIAEIDIFKEEELLKRQREMEVERESPKQNVNITKQPYKDFNAQSITTKIEKQSSTRIQVEASKLDHLMFLVSELVTSKSELLLAIEAKDEERTLESAMKVDKLSKLFRDNALDIRLISMQELIMRFNRLVRDLANSLGKKVDFETTGEDVELDKNIIDSINEPIMHLIRNCIDHGIETPEQRLKNNKPETGIVKLFAYKSGNFVFIQISDDGNGIDKQKIIRKAISKGLISENAQLSEKEIYDLIFQPGFSTAESLTQVSGRGVGLDIVRKKIQDIRGEIHIDSEAGLGTSFTLKLQQTISIIDTLLISAAGTRYAIPLEDVEKCQILDFENLQFNQNKQIAFDNEIIPYFSIGEEFHNLHQLPEKQRMIIINKRDKKFAVLVDEIIGEYQAVIKPLGKSFTEIEFVSGASLLGDGAIALLLDTDKLKKMISAR